MKWVTQKQLLRAMLLLAGVALFAGMLYVAGWPTIYALFAQITLWDIGLLVVANGFVLLMLNARWAILLNAQGFRIPFWRLLGYRLAAFGVSYFTPGPHFGGEPLQVYLLVAREEVDSDVAIASVTLDKLLELIVNAAFLLLCLTVVLQGGVAGSAPANWQGIGAALLLLAIPVVVLASIWAGYRPLSALTRTIRREDRKRNPATLPLGGTGSGFLPGFTRWFYTGLRSARLERLTEVLIRSEGLMYHLCRQKPRAILAALVVSILSWVGIIGEYWLATRVIGLTLPLDGVLTALVAARLAILLPMPAALGTLEASQALSIQQLGGSAATGVALSLLIRSRDVLLGILGLWLGGLGVWNAIWQSAKHQSKADDHALHIHTLPEPPHS